MKALQTVVLVVLSFIATTANANHIKADNVPGENVTTLEFANVKKGHHLSIKDSQSITLYAEYVKADGNYVKYFDLRSLENGNYTFEMDKNIEIVVRQFNVLNGKVTFIENADSKFFKPTAQLRNNQLLVSQLTDPSSTLQIEIYYNNQLIHTDSLTGSQILNRIYQLDTDKKGNYIVVMKSGTREFFKTLTI